MADVDGERKTVGVDLMGAGRSMETVALAHPYLAPLLQGPVGARYQIVEFAQPQSPQRWAAVPHTYLSPHIAGVTDLAPG
jgi:hypothetical protein